MAKGFNYVLIVFMILLFSCNLGQSQQAKPEKVYRIVYEIKSNDWYKQQADLWKKEIKKNPKNAEAWHNYYNANRYAHFKDLDSKEKQAVLRKIIEDMGEAIPETYEYYYLKYKNSCNLSQISLIEKAHQLKPDEPEPYYDLIAYHQINGNKDKVKKFYKKLYDSKDTAPWLINYNYNVLMSADKNAIIFTNGDNDTYPVRMLQEVKGVREDVTILNISLSAVHSYLKNKLEEKSMAFDLSDFKNKYFDLTAERPSQRYLSHEFIQDFCEIVSENHPDIPIYFALTVYENYIRNIKDDLYIVGLAYRYSPNRIDNFALVKRNLEKKFRLDYLKYDWYTEHLPGKHLMATMHMNYVPTMVMLAEHYKTSGEVEKAREWKNIALDISRQAGNQKAIEDIEKKDL